jgi:hypothetical protein
MKLIQQEQHSKAFFFSRNLHHSQIVKTQYVSHTASTPADIEDKGPASLWEKIGEASTVTVYQLVNP